GVIGGHRLPSSNGGSAVNLDVLRRPKCASPTASILPWRQSARQNHARLRPRPDGLRRLREPRLSWDQRKRRREPFGTTTLFLDSLRRQSIIRPSSSSRVPTMPPVPRNSGLFPSLGVAHFLFPPVQTGQGFT